MGETISFIFALLLLFGGSRERADLLDMVSTETYWQIEKVATSTEQLEKEAGPDGPAADAGKYIKDLGAADFATRNGARVSLEELGPAILPQLRTAAASSDPEVAAVAGELIKKFSEHGKSRAIRRLMAIRTLGEKKEAHALPLLRGLADSKEMFVGDYARRAVAAIEGKDFATPDLTKAFVADAGLLPRDVNMVIHAGRLGREPLTLPELVDGMLAGSGRMGLIGGPNGLPMDKKSAVFKLTQRLLSVVERVGDVRLDGVTAGIKIGGDGSFLMLTVRGKYDSALVFEALRGMEDMRTAKVTPAVKAGDVAMITDNEDGTTMLFPDDERAVLITALEGKLDRETREQMVAAIGKGKGTLEENKELAGLMKTIDAGAPVWAVLQVTQEMKKEKLWEGFVTLALQSRMGKEAVAFTITGEGEDEAKVKGSVEYVNQEIQTELAAGKQAAQQEPLLQPAVDFLASMQGVAEGKKGKLTGEVKSTLVQTFMMEVGPMFMELLDDPAPPGAVPNGPGGQGAVPNAPPAVKENALPDPAAVPGK